MKTCTTAARTGRIMGVIAALGAALLVGPAPAEASTQNLGAAQGFSAPLRGPAHASSQARPSYNSNGGIWSGYVALISGVKSVSASWTEPAVTCNSAGDVFGPWVGIGGVLSNSVEQTGVETNCFSNRPVYRAWYEMAPAPPVYYSNPVGPGDSISAKVTRVGTSYTVTLSNNTRHWTETVTKSDKGDDASAEVIVESPITAYPNFGKVTFTGAKVDGKPLSSYRPIALDASNSNGYEDHTGALSGGTFSVSYRHE
jgi:hypothetical protein